MGQRQTRSRAVVSRNGAGVGICWQLGYVGSVASQIQRGKKEIWIRFPFFLLFGKKKKTFKKMRSDIVNVHRAAVMQHAGLLGEAWELGRRSQLALKVKATLSCPESILTFRIN